MLTDRQQQILDFIREYSQSEGFPPSVREIGRQFGIYPATVQDHIDALERKGYLQKKRFQSRSLSIAGRSGPSRATKRSVDAVTVPLLGRVAAGSPILAEENVDDAFELPAGWAQPGSFLLRVRGSSMEGAHILDGDMVLVQPQATASNGQIVVAMIENEATVKRFYRTARGVELRAENPDFATIEIPKQETKDLRILGRVAGVLRIDTKKR